MKQPQRKRGGQSAARDKPRTQAPARWWLPLGLLVYAGIAVTGVAIASLSQEVRTLFVELERNRRAEDALLAQQSRLLLERSTLASYKNVDEVAEQRLSMRFPEQAEQVQP